MTNYSNRNTITTSYSLRPGIVFIATEILDYLMTEDDNYLITDESIYNEYGTRTIINSSYSTRPIIA